MLGTTPMPSGDILNFHTLKLQNWKKKKTKNKIENKNKNNPVDTMKFQYSRVLFMY